MLANLSSVLSITLFAIRAVHTPLEIMTFLLQTSLTFLPCFCFVSPFLAGHCGSHILLCNLHWSSVAVGIVQRLQAPVPGVYCVFLLFLVVGFAVFSAFQLPPELCISC